MPELARRTSVTLEMHSERDDCIQSATLFLIVSIIYCPVCCVHHEPFSKHRLLIHLMFV